MCALQMMDTIPLVIYLSNRREKNDPCSSDFKQTEVRNRKLFKSLFLAEGKNVSREDLFEDKWCET